MHTTYLRFLEHLGSCVLLLLLCLIFFFPFGCSVSTSPLGMPGPAAQNSAPVVAPQFFGLTVEDDRHWPVVSFGAKRLWADGLTWAAIEPARDVYNWAPLDMAVTRAESAGTTVLLTLGQTPAWASSNPGLVTVWGAGASAPPASLADWDDYLAAVAARYKGRIDAYEVWNDPSDVASWSGSEQQMLALAADAYGILKQVDPKVLVLTPGGNPNWMAQYLADGGGRYADVAGAALTPSPAAPETAQQMVAQLRTAMQQAGVGQLPVWNTADEWTPPADFTAEEAAEWLARSLLINAAAGVGRVYWFAWDDQSHVSLKLTDASYAPTAAGYAYGQVSQWLTGATLSGCSEDASGTWRCQLLRGSQVQWVLWNTKGTIPASTNGAAERVGLDGTIQPVTGLDTVEVGGSPVLLR